MDIDKNNELEQFLSQEETIGTHIEPTNNETIEVKAFDSFDLTNEFDKICNNNFEDGGIIVSTSSVGPFNTSEFDFSEDFIGHSDIINNSSDTMVFDQNLLNGLKSSDDVDPIGIDNSLESDERFNQSIANLKNKIVDINNIPDLQKYNKDDGKTDSGVDIRESVAKKQRLLDKKTVDEIAFKFDLNEKDTDNLKKLNTSDAINVDFFLKLREILKLVPIKSKIMDEFKIRKSYTGFHDWFDGERIDLPNVGMNSIAQNLGYSLMIVPIRNNKLDSKYKVAIDNLQLDFLDEIEERIQVLVKEEASKVKPKKLVKQTDTSHVLKAMASGDNSDEALGFINEDNKMVNDDTINENEKYIDTNETIIERTVILDDNISFELSSNIANSNYNFDSNDVYKFDPTNMEQIGQDVPLKTTVVEEEFGLVPIKTNIESLGNIGGVEIMDYNYDDSIEETVTETKKIITDSPFKEKNI